MLGKWGRLLFNPLVAAQNFEYKMSNVSREVSQIGLRYAYRPANLFLPDT